LVKVTGDKGPMRGTVNATDNAQRIVVVVADCHKFNGNWGSTRRSIDSVAGIRDAYDGNSSEPTRNLFRHSAHKSPLNQDQVFKMENQENNQPQPRTIHVDDSKAISCYANFCRVTGSPEELIVDFGMNAQPMGASDQPVEIQQRIVLNFFTAKRLLHALHVSIQRHEDVFGSIETDIQKRVRPRENARASKN